MEIKLNNVTHRFGKITAVRDFSITIPENKLVVLLGPSGSGKSTILSLINGLLPPDEGEIYLGGKLSSTSRKIIIPPQYRQIGMVFQTLALWPHMTVRGNLEFVLKGKCPRDEMSGRIDKLLELTGLKDYAHTYPPYLSGGEQQRLALARALVINPRILLLDEPLSSLDRNLSRKLCAEIKTFHQQFSTTTLYVTHDQSEALMMADLVAVIEGGRLIQADTPEALYQRPVNKFVASFIGEGTLIEGELTKPDLVKTPLGEIPCLVNSAITDRKVKVLLRPENLRLNPAGHIKGKIISSEFTGDRWFIRVATTQKYTLAIWSDTARPEGEVFLDIHQPWIIPR